MGIREGLLEVFTMGGRYPIVRIVAMPDVQKRLTEQGLEPQSSSPDDFRDFMRRELDKWTKVALRAGVRPGR